jgi:hypothetical protein
MSEEGQARKGDARIRSKERAGPEMSCDALTGQGSGLGIEWTLRPPFRVLGMKQGPARKEKARVSFSDNLFYNLQSISPS